jgi:hypothetical protein
MAPQIVKGGKYVFGWSRVGKEGKIIIPKEAYDEYALSLDPEVTLFSGSKTSGGFGLSSIRILKNSRIEEFIINFPSLINYELAEGEIIIIKSKKYCWLKINDDMSINLPETTLDSFGIKKGDILLSGRGSYLAIAFITKGFIFNEAKRHPEVERFF